MNDFPLFDAAPIHGQDYQPLRDRARLTGQLEKLFELMKDGCWRTLDSIEQRTGIRSASASAQLRNLRKMYFTVEKRYIDNGLYEYRVVNLGQ